MKGHGHKMTKDEFTDGLDPSIQRVRDGECEVHTVIVLMQTDKQNGMSVVGDAQNVLELLLKAAPKVVEVVRRVRPDLVQAFVDTVRQMAPGLTDVPERSDTSADLSEFTRRAKFVH